MPGVLYDVNNVVVGNANLYYKAWNATTPATLVPDNTAIFTSTTWETAGWTVAGATNEGFKVNFEKSTTQIMIEEQSTPVQETIESANVGIEAELAEATIENMKLAWNGSAITTVAAASGVPGTKKMTLTDTVQYWAVALETKNLNGFARRILVPKMTAVGSGETVFRRAAEKQMHPMRWSMMCKPTDVQVVDITAAALP